MGCGSSSDTGNAANETSENAAQIEMVTKFGRVSTFLFLKTFCLIYSLNSFN